MCCPTNKVVKSTVMHLLRLGCGTLSDFPLQYCILIVVLEFGRGAVAKLSGGFTLQYHPLIALAFDRGAVARMSIHDQQAHRLPVERLGCVDSYYVSPSSVKYVLM